MAIDGRLVQLKEDLRQRGYQVVDIGEEGKVDAIIYYDEGHQEGGPGTGLLNEGLYNGGMEGPAFLVNAYNRDGDEIHRILQRKTYSPLFTGLE